MHYFYTIIYVISLYKQIDILYVINSLSLVCNKDAAPLRV